MTGAGFGVLQRLGRQRFQYIANTSLDTRQLPRLLSNWLSATVAIKRSPATALASSAATSIARFAPLEPSVATITCRIRCFARLVVVVFDTRLARVPKTYR